MTYTPFPVWPRPSDEGGGVTSHGALTGRSSADQHPIDAITGLRAAIDAAGGGGGSIEFFDVAISDPGDDIDLDVAPTNATNVLVVDRTTAAENGLYDMDTVDGWTLVDPQPTGAVYVKETIDYPGFTAIYSDDVEWVMYFWEDPNWVRRGFILDEDAVAPATRLVGTALGTTGTVDLDMEVVHGTIQTIAATGAITFTTSNRAAGREVTLVIAAGGSSRTLAWPSWIAVGATLPTTLASGKTLVATVTFIDTTDAAAIATAAVQP